MTEVQAGHAGLPGPGHCPAGAGSSLGALRSKRLGILRDIHGTGKRFAALVRQQSEDCNFLHILYITSMLTYLPCFCIQMHINAYKCTGDILMGLLHILCIFCAYFVHILICI